jgi:hypothetical protein
VRENGRALLIHAPQGRFDPHFQGFPRLWYWLPYWLVWWAYLACEKGLYKGRTLHEKGFGNIALSSVELTISKWKTSAYIIRFRLRRASKPAIRFGKWTLWFSVGNLLMEIVRGVEDIFNPIAAAGLMGLLGRIRKKRNVLTFPSKKRARRTKIFWGSHSKRKFHKKWKRRAVWTAIFLASLEGAIAGFQWWMSDIDAYYVVCLDNELTH